MNLNHIQALKTHFAMWSCIILVACANEPSQPATTATVADTVSHANPVETTTQAISESTSELLKVKFFRDSDESRYDTIVHYSHLQHDMFPLATFNYPSLTNKTENGNSYTLFNDSISVRITKKPFDPKAHKLSYKKYGKDEQQVLETIDGESFFGTDGEVPTWEISEINIVQNGKSFSFPKGEIKYYYQPNFNLTDVYLTDDGRIILWMVNSDGAGGYYIVWIWRNGEILQRFVEEGF
jgi:hypothetical protein